MASTSGYKILKSRHAEEGKEDRKGITFQMFIFSNKIQGITSISQKIANFTLKVNWSKKTKTKQFFF